MQKLVTLQVPLDGGETKGAISGSTYRAEARAVVVLFAGGEFVASPVGARISGSRLLDDEEH
jgi:hypothetical protein